ncbi:hypothetical protein [Sphingomonas endophytica]|nr:hypothetical protein [Sphingomonas endophytica]
MANKTRVHRDHRNRDQFYAEAKKRNIVGHSRMTKAELLDVLA